MVFKWVRKMFRFPETESPRLPVHSEESTMLTLRRAALVEQKFDREFNALIEQLDGIKREARSENNNE